MKIQRGLFWYLLISTVMTLFNGFHIPSVPLVPSNFLVANLMYWFYYQQKHGIWILALFLTAAFIMLLTVIMILIGKWQAWLFHVLLALTFSLYIIDLARNCFFIIKAISTIEYPSKILSIATYSLMALGDLSFLIIGIIFIACVCRQRLKKELQLR